MYVHMQGHMGTHVLVCSVGPGNAGADEHSKIHSTSSCVPISKLTRDTYMQIFMGRVALQTCNTGLALCSLSLPQAFLSVCHSSRVSKAQGRGQMLYGNSTNHQSHSSVPNA